MGGNPQGCFLGVSLGVGGGLYSPLQLTLISFYMYILESYNDLYQWSVDCFQDFWETFWQFSGIIASCPYTKVGQSMSEYGKI